MFRTAGVRLHQAESVDEADFLLTATGVFGTATITSIVHTTSVTAAACAPETIKIGKHCNLTGGIGWHRFDTDYSQEVALATAFRRTDELPS